MRISCSLNLRAADVEAARSETARFEKMVASVAPGLSVQPAQVSPSPPGYAAALQIVIPSSLDPSDFHALLSAALGSGWSWQGTSSRSAWSRPDGPLQRIELRMLENAGARPKVCCCEPMLRHLADHDEVVAFRAGSGQYLIPVHDGGSSGVVIRYCPWCGEDLAPATDGR